MRSPLPLILALSLVPPAVPAAGRAAGPPRAAGTVELHSFTRIEGHVIFAGNLDGGPAGSCTLWATDGTAAGTSRLAGCGFPVATTGVIAFFTDSSDRLWRTDGTAENTFQLGDVTVGRGIAGLDVPIVSPDFRSVLFVGCTVKYGCEPWHSNGTRKGTVMLADLRRGPASSNPTDFVVVGRRVLFATYGAVWITNGSAEGTVRLFPASGAVLGLQPFGPRTYLETGAGTLEVAQLTYFETYNGVAEVVQVFDARSRRVRKLLKHEDRGATGGIELIEAGGRMLLSPFDRSTPERSLWTTDGTSAGTFQLGSKITGLDSVTSAGRRVVFTAGTGPVFGGAQELWFLDPERKAPERFAGCPGGCPTLQPAPNLIGLASPLVPFQGGILLAGQDPQHGAELWITDGTPEGTHLLKDLCPGACDGSPSGFRLVLDRVLFLDSGRNLWVTDGTEAGTLRLASQPRLSVPVDTAELDDGRIIFDALDAQGVSQLWVSDLTPEGTAPLPP
jgi:ELWxxDGT repeat protein